MIPKVLSSKVNLVTQTEVSAFDSKSTFDFSNDANTLLALENPQISYQPEMVRDVIRPLGIAKNGTVISHHIPRLFKRQNTEMLRSLQEQIRENPKSRNDLVKQMAAALVPGLEEKEYQSLFSNPIKLPYRVVPASLCLCGQTVTTPCTAIFSLDGTLSVVSETQTIRCSIELWDTIISGRELDLIQGDQPFGKLRVSETVQGIDFSKHIPQALLNCLKVKSEDDLDNIITPDDTSFVDIVLSIPTLTQREANDLLTILHSRKLLRPYLRSKVCQIQLSNPTEKRDWPELLGRFIYILDPKWTLTNINLLKDNDAMSLFRHVKDMNGSALYVLQTALNALDEVRGSDSIVFFWTLLFLSIMVNATYNNVHGQVLYQKLLQIWRELQKKDADSNTRKLTTEIIEYVKSIERFKIDSSVHEEVEFVQFIFKDHHDEIYQIVSLSPFSKEESHPLFYPTVLALETALGQADRGEDFISSQSESLTGDFDSSAYSRSSRRGAKQADNQDQYLSGDSRSSRSSRQSRQSTHSTHSKQSASRNSRVAPELQQQQGMESAGDSNSESSQYSRSRSRSSRKQPAPIINDQLDSGVNESASSRKSRSSRSSQRAPPPPMVEKLDLGDYSDNDSGYSDNNMPPPPPQQMIPEKLQSSSHQSHPQKDEYSDEYDDDQQAQPSPKSQSYKSAPRSQSKKEASQYSVTDSEYSEEPQKEGSVKQAPALSPQNDDSYDYYSDEEPAPKAPSQKSPSVKSGSQKSQPLAQASSQAQRSGAVPDEKSYSSKNQSVKSRQSQRQSEAEYSTSEYSTKQSQSQSSRARLAAIKAASQKSSGAKQADFPIPSPNVQQNNDDEYSYYSDEEVPIKNTATTGYKTNGYTNSYTPTQGTPSAKSGNHQEPIEDKEEPYDYDDEYYSD